MDHVSNYNFIRHIAPLFQDNGLTVAIIDQLYKQVKDLDITHVVAIEARGFLFGIPLQMKLGASLTLARKKNKLPGERVSIEYDLEYGSDILEIEKETLPEGSKCLIVDDLLATGGTMKAVKKLVEMSGSNVTACLVVIDLVDLHKPEVLEDAKLFSLFRY